MTVKGTYTYDYPRPAVTTDCVIFGYDGKELKVLLEADFCNKIGRAHV